MSGFDDEPAPSLQLTGEQVRGHSPNQRLGVRHRRPRFGRQSAFVVYGGLEPGDQPLCLVPGELARGLTLREPHRSTRIPKVLVTRSLQKRQQLIHLTRSGRRTGRLTEGHAPVNRVWRWRCGILTAQQA